MTITTCGTCRFSAPALDANRKINFTQRLCKFMPPTPMLIPNPNGGLGMQSVWPIMDTGQNCGQWQEVRAEPLLPGERPLSKPAEVD